MDAITNPVWSRIFESPRSLGRHAIMRAFVQFIMDTFLGSLVTGGVAVVMMWHPKIFWINAEPISFV